MESEYGLKSPTEAIVVEPQPTGPPPTVVTTQNYPNLRTGHLTIGSLSTAGSVGFPTSLPTLAIPNGVSVAIKAKKTNTGIIYIGWDSQSALHTGSGWFDLAAGDVVELNITDLSAVWYDGDTAGDIIEWIVEQP